MQTCSRYTYMVLSSKQLCTVLKAYESALPPGVQRSTIHIIGFGAAQAWLMMEAIHVEVLIGVADHILVVMSSAFRSCGLCFRLQKHCVAHVEMAMVFFFCRTPDRYPSAAQNQPAWL
ncbi:hypothetical protein AKJ16_DCAP10157 [Drosera capensis]